MKTGNIIVVKKKNVLVKNQKTFFIPSTYHILKRLYAGTKLRPSKINKYEFKEAIRRLKNNQKQKEKIKRHIQYFLKSKIKATGTEQKNHSKFQTTTNFKGLQYKVTMYKRYHEMLNKPLDTCRFEFEKVNIINRQNAINIEVPKEFKQVIQKQKQKVTDIINVGLGENYMKN